MKLPFFLFDIGASHTRVGFSFDGENIVNTEIYPTPENFEAGINLLEQKAKSLVANQKANAIVGGIAGHLNLERTMVAYAPNLPDWNNKPLAEELMKRTGAKVFLENDTAMVGLGEAVKGAGRVFKIVAYMTVSTGVNGVLIVDKKIAPNSFGFEIGKQIIDFDSSYDKNARNFEDLVAGSQFPRRHGKESYEITNVDVWEEEARLIAYGVNNMILFWSPDIVVLGGGVIKQVPIDKVREKVSETLTIFGKLPQIKIAEIADFGGLFGALHYAKLLA